MEFFQEKEEKEKSIILSKINEIEERIQRDEGNRGIKEILLPQGELYNAAKSLLPKKRIAIITGFPCLLDYTPPTETDGPLGAVAIAKTLIELEKEVVILTDECNEEPLLASVAGAGLSSPLLLLESFPSRNDFEDEDFIRLEALSRTFDAVIAIERAGPSHDGICRTMRGFDMNHLVAPLELLFIPPNTETDNINEIVNELENDEENIDLIHPNLSLPLTTIGIGDGGNEVGMGKIYDTIIQSKISNATQIACTVASDYLITSSVSNWGGYALAASIALVWLESNPIINDRNEEINEDNFKKILQKLIPTEEEQLESCKSLVAAGARDGILKTQDLFVDGMPIESSLLVLREIREIALK